MNIENFQEPPWAVSVDNITIDKHNDHYKASAIQPFDVIDAWPIEQQVGFHRGNILKYAMRLGNKDERLKEAEKIAVYAQKLVDTLKNQS